MKYIINLINQCDLRSLISSFVNLGIIIIFICATRKSRPLIRKSGYTILIILIIRIALFNQPFSWNFYNSYLDGKNVGWRQKKVILQKHKEFLRKPKNIKFLAVGSSQTNAVYGHYASKHDNFETIVLPGCDALSLALYRKHIESFKPKYLLLYLSEFELARPPSLSAATVSPRQGLSFIQIYPILKDTRKSFKSKTSINELLMGELFPEYKYSFIFKNIFNKLIKKNDSLTTPSQSVKISYGEYFKTSIKKLTGKGRSIPGINLNVRFLRTFLTYFKDKPLKIIIVEGQYNPLAYTKKNLKLNKIAYNKLKALGDEFRNVTFIARKDIMEFTEKDYKDGTHVKSMSGYAFSKKLMNILRNRSLIE